MRLHIIRPVLLHSNIRQSLLLKLRKLPVEPPTVLILEAGVHVVQQRANIRYRYTMPPLLEI
jgi:hypothetical protein